MEMRDIYRFLAKKSRFSMFKMDLLEYLRYKTALNVRKGIYFHFLIKITSSFTVKL